MHLRFVVASALLVGCGSGKVNGPTGPEFEGPAQFACDAPDDGDQVFYVAVDGDDGADGSEASPWATIGHGITQIPDGATLLVGPGTYTGRIRLDSQFSEGVTVRAEPSYQARLQNDATVITVYEGQGITLSGFDISHSGPGADALIIQIQDLIGEPGGANAVSRITLRNNIIHDSFNNDILKINNGAREIVVERNVFYNQQGSDEHIDINSVGDIVIQDNIFFNDFEASGRSNNSETSSFIVVKDSNGDEDSYVGAENITIRRNILLNYQGSRGANFILVGEDGNPYHEAVGLIVENNLLVGNGSDEVRAPFGLKGVKDVLFRHNTVVGDMPSEAFAFRFNQEGDNPTNQNITLVNNIWADATGTMGDFSDTPIGETDGFSIDNNLYWNGASPIPNDADSDLINPSDDGAAIEADPAIEAVEQRMPTWRVEDLRFSDGSGDICQAFEELVESYGTLGSGSAAVGAARGDESPETDILGNSRPNSPSVGAYEP